MKFKIGQVVVVLQAHAGGADLEGTIVRKGTANSEYANKWWIDLKGGDGLLPVEPERIVDSNVYYARQRAKYAHPPKS